MADPPAARFVRSRATVATMQFVLVVVPVTLALMGGAFLWVMGALLHVHEGPASGRTSVLLHELALGTIVWLGPLAGGVFLWSSVLHRACGRGTPERLSVWQRAALWSGVFSASGLLILGLGVVRPVFWLAVWIYLCVSPIVLAVRSWRGDDRTREPA